MNVKSPKKRVKSLKDRNQESLFLPPYFLGNSVPKHNIRAFNDVQPEVKLMSHMPSMMNEDDFNIHNNHDPYDLYPPNFNDYTGDPFDLFSADLFDDLEEDAPHENKVYEEPVLLDTTELIPFPEDLFESSESECDNIAYQQVLETAPALETNEGVDVSSSENKTQLEKKGNVNNSKKDSTKGKRGYASSIDKDIPDEAIASHMLTPLLWQWISSLSDNGLINKGRARQQLKLFIKFLIDKRIERPTTDDAYIYVRDVLLKTDKSIAVKRSYKVVINSFFSWTNELQKYDNIMKDIVLTLCRDEKTGTAFLVASDKRARKTHIQLPEALQNLMDALELKVKNLDGKFSGPCYNYEISNFVIFCNMNSIKRPEQRDLINYCVRSFHITTEALDILDDFFTWTASNNIYENLAKGIKNIHISVRDNATMGRPARFEPAKIQGTNTPIDIAVNAGFIYDRVQFLMQNDLVVFKDWLATSPGSLEVQTHVLNFAHFLHSNHITTPTQQSIVDYYNLNLSKRCPSLASVYLAHVKKFFQWTAEKRRYPNITINVAWIFRNNLGDTDCPILTANNKRKPIPSAKNPLIVFH